MHAWPPDTDALYTALKMHLKGYHGLGVKFLNRGQNFTKNAEKIPEYFCLERLRELISEKNANPLDKVAYLAT